MKNPPKENRSPKHARESIGEGFAAFRPQVIRQLEARREELQGDRADVLAGFDPSQQEAAEEKWNERHGEELREVLEAIEAVGGVP
jgi:malate synthase